MSALEKASLLDHADDDPLLAWRANQRRPSRPRRALLIALAGLLLVLYSFACIVLAHKARQGLSKTVGIAWYPCPDGIGFECAFLSVPLDWTRPLANETVSLALRKWPATAPVTERRGAMLINPGGPGGSGHGFIMSAGPKLSVVVNGKYDLISWDPRGVNLTTPALNCYQNQAQAALAQYLGGWGALGLPFESRYAEQNSSVVGGGEVGPAELAHLAKIDSAMEAMGRQCDTYGHPKMMKAVSTSFVARDIIAILDALGQEQLVYWGFSYGTILGATFAAMFPDRVGRIVLDGVSDAVSYTNDMYEWGRSGMTDSNKVFDGLFIECAAAGYPRCAFASPTSLSSATDLKRRYDALEQRLLTGPLPVSSWRFGSGFLTASVLSQALFTTLYSPSLWPRFMQAVADAEQGNGTGLYEYTPGRILGDLQWKDQTTNVFNRHMETIGMMGTVSIMCGDSTGMEELGMTPATAAYVRELRERSVTGESWALWVLQCRRWRQRPFEAYRGPWSIAEGLNQTAFPVLFVSNTADPVTPLAAGRSMSKAFGNSSARLVVHDGYGHCTIAHPSLCTALTIRRYFNGELPEDGKVCSADDGFLFPDRNASIVAAEASDIELRQALAELSLTERRHWLGV